MINTIITSIDRARVLASRTRTEEGIFNMPLPITSPESPLDVLIVGGGLSGLIVAFKLSQLPQFQPQSSGVSSRGTDSTYRGLKWHLFESQPQLGGRIQNDSLGYNIDMGGGKRSFPQIVISFPLLCFVFLIYLTIL